MAEREPSPQRTDSWEDRCNYDVDSLAIYGGEVGAATKLIRKLQPQIVKKQGKQISHTRYKSKRLPKYEQQVKNAYEDLKKNAALILDLLENAVTVDKRERADKLMSRSVGPSARTKWTAETPWNREAIERLQQEKSTLESQLTELKESTGSLRNKYERKADECSRLQKDLDDIQRKRDEELRTMGDLRREKDELNQRLQMRERSNEKLQQKEAEVKQTIDQLDSAKYQTEVRLTQEQKRRSQAEENASLQLQRVETLQTEKALLVKELQETKEANETFQVNLESTQTQLASVMLEKNSLANELDKSKKRILQFQSNLESKQSEKLHMQENLRKEQENSQAIRSKVTEMELAIDSKQSEILHMQQRLKTEQENSQAAQSKVRELELALDRKGREYQSVLSEKENTVQRLQRSDQESTSLRDSLLAETAAKDDALHRLSELASSKLLDNNPNITDLSDSNRPTKLAEKMMELYDNEWTDACDEFEQHMKKKDEASCANALLEILKVVYERCLSTSAEQLQSITELMICPLQRSASDVTPDSSNAVTSQVQQVQKNVKDQRKTLSVTTIKRITPILFKYVEDHETNEDHKKLLSKQEVKGYVDKCVEICWLMAIQDPPLSLGWGADGNGYFDTTLFREYTKRGDMIDFVVWPILYLHEGGPLLAKGIAQGKTKE